MLVTYRFDGPADDIYATLVVRLHHTVAFQSTDLWKSAADFMTQTETKLGFTLKRHGERTRLACGFPRPRGKHRAQRISPAFQEIPRAKALDARARPATPGGGCASDSCFGG